MMDKKILEDYMDACALIKETEEDIARLKRKKKKIVQESVIGSNPEWPYEPMHFHIEGTPYTYSDDKQLRREERILEERKQQAEKIKRSAEEYMNCATVRMQRIVRLRIFKGLTWQQVALQMGRKCTADSIRMEFQRWIEEK